MSAVIKRAIYIGPKTNQLNFGVTGTIKPALADKDLIRFYPDDKRLVVSLVLKQHLQINYEM